METSDRTIDHKLEEDIRGISDSELEQRIASIKENLSVMAMGWLLVGKPNDDLQNRIDAEDELLGFLESEESRRRVNKQAQDELVKLTEELPSKHSKYVIDRLWILLHQPERYSFGYTPTQQDQFKELFISEAQRRDIDVTQILQFSTKEEMREYLDTM